MTSNRFGIPELGVGVGLRTAHYRAILEDEAKGHGVEWFEILSENYMQTAGRPLHFVERVAARFPIAMHGVSMSIGSTDPLDQGYLKELVTLRDRLGARWVSDHLCWTGVGGTNTHDLLPMPYTEEALRHVTERVKAVQDVLGAPLALENPSSYLEFASNQMPEWEFLARLAEGADCALLLDVNNVYVSAFNHGFAPEAYLDAVPYDRVVQVHVAGHTRYPTHIIDTHVGPVPDPVWSLLERVAGRTTASVLVEWDAEIPEFPVVAAEAERARAVLARGRRSVAPTAPSASTRAEASA